MFSLQINDGATETQFCSLYNQIQITVALAKAFLKFINEMQVILQNIISWWQIYKPFNFEDTNYDLTVPG